MESTKSPSDAVIAEPAPEPPPPRDLLAAADDYLQRLSIGLAVSLFAHIGALLIAVLLLGSPPGGGTTYVEISLGPDSPADTNEDENRNRLSEATQNVEPPQPEEDIQPEPNVDVAERSRQIEETLDEAEQLAEKEFADLAARSEAERAADNEARLQGLRDVDDRVSGNVESRQGMASLEPKTFYGLKVHTRKVIFVLDISGSMDLEFAKLNLRNAYRDLEDDASFGIVVYNHEVKSWKSRLVKATPENKRSADEFLETFQAFGATNIYGALQLAFSISNNSVTRADTIYFLTDGMPNRGKVIEPGGILMAVRRWNSNERVIIHAIQILGPMARSPAEKIEEARDFMQRLARENNGVYVERK